MKKTIEPKNWVKINIDLEKIKKNINSSIIESYNYGNFEDENVVAYVEDWVSGSYGHHQTKKIAELFNFEEIIEDEWLIEDVSQFASEITEIINEQLNLTGTLSLGNLDSDGSYGLFYTIEKSLFEEEYSEVIM